MAWWSARKEEKRFRVTKRLPSDSRDTTVYSVAACDASSRYPVTRMVSAADASIG